MIDTGADLRAPDIAAKAPVTYSVVSETKSIRDEVGYGTLVTALAGGSELERAGGAATRAGAAPSTLTLTAAPRRGRAPLAVSVGAAVAPASAVRR